MKEIWVKIKGYKNYQVSNLGRVKSTERRGTKGGFIKQQYNRKGYFQVALSDNGITKWKKVHRLVYEAFYGKIPFWMQVNHINEIKTDNRLCNLNIMTAEQNNNWGTRTERATQKLSKPIEQYDLEGNFINEYKSARDASRQTGLNISGICLCCNKKRNYCGGYVWKYKKAV